MSHWIALFVCVLANVASNYALKSFATTMPTTLDRAALPALATNLWLWAGVAAAGTVFVTYIWAIRGVPLSIAYPLATGLSVIGVAICATTLLGETIDGWRLAGMALIVVGAAILILR